ncbi:unnamed protein product [Ixodes persulcatus]
MLRGCMAIGRSEILGDGCLGEPTLPLADDGTSGNSDAAVELWMPYSRYTPAPARRSSATQQRNTSQAETSRSTSRQMLRKAPMAGSQGTIGTLKVSTPPRSPAAAPPGVAWGCLDSSTRRQATTTALTVDTTAHAEATACPSNLDPSSMAADKTNRDTMMPATARSDLRAVTDVGSLNVPPWTSVRAATRSRSRYSRTRASVSLLWSSSSSSSSSSSDDEDVAVGSELASSLDGDSGGGSSRRRSYAVRLGGW